MAGHPSLFISFGVGAAVALAAAILTWRVMGERRATTLAKRVELLHEENDRLRRLVDEAEKSRARASNQAERETIEKEVVAIRGLPFKNPVDYEVLDRRQIKETIARKLAEVFSEAEFEHLTLALVRLGLLEAEYPLRERYIELLGEQVAAFYDQHTHKLFMFEDASLDNSQNRIVLAHELTHALQDQHFGLKRLPLELKTNDDRAAAASALCEGDATLVMSEYMLKNMSLAVLKDNVTGMLAQNMEQLAKAPRYLREMLVFPYLRGQEFCTALFARGGYDAINRAYSQPPSSTAQILDPQKYLGEVRDEPVAIEWPDLHAGGQKPIADNVVGEMGIRILFSEWIDAAVGEQAGSGWRGDRYLCFDAGGALVWKSIWATPEEAVEFMAAGKQTLGKRYGAETERKIQWLTPQPNVVVLIDASDESWASALAEKFGT